MKISLFLLIAFLILGCASTAHRPYACSEGMSRKNVYGWFYWLAGMTIQQGDCAIIDPLKFESGGYYHRNKSKIDWDVHGGGGSAIDDFGLALNCKKEVLPEFKKTLIENKVAIFGKDFERSSREVTLSTLEMIKNNLALAENCR